MIQKVSEINNNTAQIGGKARNLSVLIRNSIVVPTAYVIGANLFKDFFIDFNPKLKHELEGLDELLFNGNVEQFSKKIIKIRNEIMRANFSEKLATEIGHIFKILYNENSMIACRSSAMSEDGVTHSFAGIFDSFLNVTSRQDLINCIKKVYASQFSDHAVVYYLKNNIILQGNEMAVILQTQVDCQVSGVCFTINPVSKEEEFFVEYVEGTADSYISGRETPSFFRCSKNLVMIENTEDIVFNDLLKRELCLMAIKIKNIFGRDQDIEWCLKDGKFFFVQSRDITC